MIVNKNTKGFEVRSDKPNENWTNDNNVFIVPDGTELANKIINYYPNYNFIITNDELTDIEPIEIKQTYEEYSAQIDDFILNKIRKKYSESEEFKMLRLGTLDNTNIKFTEYNSYVEECVNWGKSEKAKYHIGSGE